MKLVAIERQRRAFPASRIGQSRVETTRVAWMSSDTSSSTWSIK